MEEYGQAVFISYAWGGESDEVVNRIDQALQQRGLKIIRRYSFITGCNNLSS